MNNHEYKKYAQQKVSPSPMGKNLFFAFLIGGLICTLGQALLEGSMHGVNLILICMIPPFFQKTGNVSTVSGLLNCCTYIGSAISTYGIALLTELYDWKLTLLVWLIIAILVTIMCLICVKPWKKAHEN